jgi:hypothetical protein
VYLSQCLIAARDGFDAETSLQTLQQLSKLDESIMGGAIPNATLVRKYDIVSYSLIEALPFVYVHM